MTSNRQVIIVVINLTVPIVFPYSVLLTHKFRNVDCFCRQQEGSNKSASHSRFSSRHKTLGKLLAAADTCPSSTQPVSTHTRPRFRFIRGRAKRGGLLKLELYYVILPFALLLRRLNSQLTRVDTGAAPSPTILA